jgi:cytochrome c2
MRTAGHALLLVGLVLVPGLCLAPPAVWRLPAHELLVLGTFVAAYLVSLVVYRLTTAPHAGLRASHALLVSVAVFGACASALMFAEWLLPVQLPVPYSREALLTSLLIGIGGFTLLHAPRLASSLLISALSVLVAVGLVGQGAYYARWLPRPIPPSRTTAVVDTTLYPLRITRYDNWIPKHWRRGGGLAAWGPDYLLATGNGALFVISERKGGDGLNVMPLPRSAPLNADEFVAGAREVFRSSPRGQFIESARFRVTDVLVQENGDFVRLLVSHHYWNVTRRCFVLRVSLLEGTRETIQDANARLGWRTLFETSPCLSLNADSHRGPRFGGLESGGRMALVSDDELLLTVGDQNFDGVNRPERLAQDPASSYGKILKINLATGDAAVFSMGHRNPQGLFVDERGTIWETEHGPRSGDEINVIRAGANYGWPIVTYGTDYSLHGWPSNPAQGRHEGFEKPLFAFALGTGISGLTGVKGDRFPLWRDDLLVATLRHQTLFRVRVEDGRVIQVEPIPIGQRIRDVLIGHDGRVLLWTDDSNIFFIEPMEDINESLVSQCTGCHGFNSWDASSPFGPNLHGIVGRRVASRNDYEYSKPMRGLSGRWTRERLDAFLSNPQEMVPGTTMQFPGIADSDDRATLIETLQQVSSHE